MLEELETPLELAQMKTVNGCAIWIEVLERPGKATARKAIKPDVAASAVASGGREVCGPVELKAALTAAASALLMASSIPRPSCLLFFLLHFSGRRPTVFHHTSTAKARGGSDRGLARLPAEPVISS